MEWIDVLGKLGIAGLALGAFTWVAKYFFSKSIDKHFEQQLLAFKSQLRTDAFVRETRWQRLDDKRLEVCLQLNTLLFEAAQAMEAWTGPIMRVPIDEEERQREMQRRAETTANSINDLNEFLRCHSFLLPAATYKLLDGGVKTLHETFNKSRIWKVSSGGDDVRDVEGLIEASHQVWETISRKIPEVQETLREEFGNLLDPNSASSARPESASAIDESSL